MYPETLDLLIKHATAAVALLRTVAGAPGYVQAFELLLRQYSAQWAAQWSATIASLRPAQLPAATILLAALLVPFAALGPTLKSTAQAPAAPAPDLAFGAVLADPDGSLASATRLVDDEGSAAPPPALGAPFLEFHSIVFEPTAPTGQRVHLARTSIERGPPFFL